MLTEEQILERYFPCCDALCFDMLQNDEGKTVALCTGQWEDEEPLQACDPRLVPIHDFAEIARLPFFLIRCANDDSRRQVMPLNAKAREILPEPVTLAKSDWAAFAEKCIESYV